MEAKDKIEQAEANLQRKLEWVSRHDARVVFAAGINIGMLGVLASTGATISEWNLDAYVIYGFTAFLLFIGLILLYNSQFPVIKPGNDSLIYFGTISQLSESNFKARSLQQDQDQYLDDLLSQIYTNSVILSSKFRDLRWALQVLGVAIVPWLACIYLSKAYFK